MTEKGKQSLHCDIATLLTMTDTLFCFYDFTVVYFNRNRVLFLALFQRK